MRADHQRWATTSRTREIRTKTGGQQQFYRRDSRNNHEAESESRAPGTFAAAITVFCWIGPGGRPAIERAIKSVFVDKRSKRRVGRTNYYSLGL